MPDSNNETCSTCNGSGNEARNSLCRDCEGEGIIPHSKKTIAARFDEFLLSPTPAKHHNKILIGITIVFTLIALAIFISSLII